MQEEELVRFESTGDVRRVLVARGDEGLRVRQEVNGPSAVVAYGEEWHTLELGFDRQGTDALDEALWVSGGVESLLRTGDADVVDLMDLCDREGIAYTYRSDGPESGPQLRPAD